MPENDLQKLQLRLAEAQDLINELARQRDVAQNELARANSRLAGNQRILDALAEQLQELKAQDGAAKAKPSGRSRKAGAANGRTETEKPHAAKAGSMASATP